MSSEAFCNSPAPASVAAVESGEVLHVEKSTFCAHPRHVTGAPPRGVCNWRRTRAQTNRKANLIDTKNR